jgi:hypothetical protein
VGGQTTVALLSEVTRRLMSRGWLFFTCVLKDYTVSVFRVEESKLRHYFFFLNVAHIYQIRRGLSPNTVTVQRALFPPYMHWKERHITPLILNLSTR